MKQFDITQWTDYVRGLADDDDAEHMQAAVRGGSEDAHRNIDILRQMAEVIELDNAQPVPEHAVRLAKAIGSLQRPDTVTHSEGLLSKVLRYLPLDITFDSVLEPAAVGTRSLQSHDRQVSFEAAGYCVDLRIERDHEFTVVVGQVLQEEVDGSGDDLVPVSSLSVVSIHDGRIVQSTLTGELGEFQSERLPNDDLKLCFLVDAEECIEFPIRS